MENASKALIIAGVMLISVALISLFVYVFSAIGEYNSQTQAQQYSNEIIAANRFFVESAYDVDSLNPGVQIYGYDVYNLIGKAMDINENPDSPNYIEIEGASKEDFKDSDGKKKIENLTTKKYTYDYGFDSEGYINRITFNGII
ncbi:MAG: hypothetical protein J6C46_01060 [Clostridia bacterium]|nr:hypothetical protein [Clostridia bacterium]